MACSVVCPSQTARQLASATYSRDGVEKFSAIEDDGGTKMKTNGADSARILRSLLNKGVMVGHMPCRSLFL